MATLAGVALFGIAAAWLVYPACIGLVAAVRRRRRVDVAHSNPFVSVVLATRESMESIRARVADCLDSDYPAELIEVVIALDRAAEGGEENALTEGFERVVVARSVGRGKAAALNAGVEAARGDSIVFADTYQRFDRQTIPRLIARLGEDGVGAVSGNLVLPAGRSPIVRSYWRYERWLRETEARVHSSVGVTGAVYAIRKHLWRPLPAGLILDDVYVPMRIVLAGHRVAFERAAVAVESRRTDPQQEYARKVRTLTGVMQLCAWLPGIMSPRRNPIWLQFVCHKLLRMLTPYWVALLGIAAFAWLLSAARTPTLVWGTTAVLAVWIILSRRGPGARLRAFATEGALLQLATVVAGFNGLRGRWSVWEK